MMHILRFRKRGRPETWHPHNMEKALFELFHDGRSLSRAEVDYKIPYPTIIKYANKVQDMLGPCADRSSNSGNVMWNYNSCMICKCSKLRERHG
jgi:hypothetical protein